MQNSPQTSFKPTREQLLAYTTDRHISVAANAGSGKTAVLTDRYIDILLKHVRNGSVERKTFSIANIVAITFTRKATGEMRERIATKLDELLKNESIQEDWKGIKQLRERFSSARISTIDSFCSQIVREYPLQAGVNPAFTIIENFKESLLIRRHIHNVLEDILVADDERATLLRQYIFYYKRATIEKIIRSFVYDPLHFLKLQNIYAGYSQQDFLDKRTALLKQFARTEAQELAEKLQQLSDLLQPYVHEFPVCKESIDLFNNFIDECIEIQHAGDMFVGTSLFQHFINTVAKLGETAFQQLFTQKGNILKKNAQQKKLRQQAEEDGSLQAIELHAGLIATTIEKTGKYPNQEAVEADGEMFATTRFLFSIAEEVAAQLNDEKDTLAQYSFADIMAKALTLLKNDSVVRAEVQSQIQYLMIDEFQDTNPVQLQLATLLVPALDDNCPLKLTEKERFFHTNLFIVGDPKQSIYRFRSADVRVFKEAQAVIRKVNREAITSGFISGTEVIVRNEKLELTPEEAEGYLFLTSSFRMNASIAGFVNTICGSMMARQESAFDVRYQPIVCGKEDLFADNLPIDLIEYPAEQASEAIPKLLASFTEEQRSKTAVLAGSNAKLIELSKQLQQFNIPFTISSGTFYESEEFTDIVSFLQFLVNPANNTACAAILRSPMFGIDDSTLLNIATLKNETLWQGVQAMAATLFLSKQHNDLLTTQEHLLLRAHTILSNILHIAPRIDAPTLIRTILADTNWKAIIAKRDKAAQMEANIEKLIAIVRQIDESGFISLSDIVEELEELGESESKEKQAEVEQQTGCVALMTVHTSKGLEFDTVICSDITSPQNSGDKRNLLFDGEFGLILKSTFVLHEDKTVQELRGGAFFIANRNEDFAEQAEYKRLIYVAITRPKHKLIICQKAAQRAGKSFINTCREITNGAETTQFRTHIGMLYNNSVAEREFEFSIQETIIPDTCSIEKTVDSPIITEADKLFSQPYTSDVLTEVFTPSMCILFNTDKDAFLYRYRLGLDEQDIQRRHDISDGVSDENASEYGTYFHAVLQYIGSWLLPDFTIDSTKLDQAFLYATNAINRKISLQEQQRFEREFSALIASPLVQEYAHALRLSTTEHSFFVPIGTDFIRGNIDIFFQKDEQTAEVWDWKTNVAPTAEDKDAKFAYYEIQLKIYILVLSRIFPRLTTYCGKIVFTRYANSADYVREISYSASEIPSLEKEIELFLQDMRSYSYGMY